MLRSIGSNWVLNLLRILVLMHLTPYVIGALGTDGNGVWVAIVSLTGFLKLLVLGVPMATVRTVAEALAKNDPERLEKAVGTCMGLCLGLGLTAAIVGGGLYFFFEGALLSNPEWAGLDPALLSAARVAFLLVVVQVSVGFVARLPYGILDAHGQFVTRNGILAGELLLRYGLTLVALGLEASVLWLAAVQVACMLAEFGVAYWVLRRRFPEVPFRLRGFDRAEVRPLLGFSLFAMLLNVGAMLAFRCDAMVIGSRLTPPDITAYDVGNKFFEPLTEIVIGIGVVVMPLATRFQVEGREGELRDVLLQWSKVALSVVLCIGLYLIVMGPEFLAWWLGPEYDPRSSRVLRILMVSFLAYLPIRGVALPILMGLNRPARPAGALVVMGVVNIAISLALVGRHGILGVAIGTAVPNGLFAVYVLGLTCRELGVGPLDWLRYVVLKPAVGSAAGLAFLLALKAAIPDPNTLEVFAGGIAFVAFFGLVWVFYVYRDDPYFDLHGQLRTRLRARTGDGRP